MNHLEALQAAYEEARRAARETPCAETQNAAKAAWTALEAAAPRRTGNRALQSRAALRHGAFAQYRAR